MTVFHFGFYCLKNATAVQTLVHKKGVDAEYTGSHLFTPTPQGSMHRTIDVITLFTGNFMSIDQRECVFCVNSVKRFHVAALRWKILQPLHA